MNFSLACFASALLLLSPLRCHVTEAAADTAGDHIAHAVCVNLVVLGGLLGTGALWAWALAVYCRLLPNATATAKFMHRWVTPVPAVAVTAAMACFLASSKTVDSEEHSFLLGLSDSPDIWYTAYMLMYSVVIAYLLSLILFGLLRLRCDPRSRRVARLHLAAAVAAFGVPIAQLPGQAYPVWALADFALMSTTLTLLAWAVLRSYNQRARMPGPLLLVVN